MEMEKRTLLGELGAGTAASAGNEETPSQQILGQGATEGLDESLIEPVVPLHAIERSLRKFLGDREDADEVIAAILKDLTPGD